MIAFACLISSLFFSGVGGFGRALKSGAPHCTHGCTDSCWELLPNEPLPGPPSFVANTTRDLGSVSSDRITYRYGVDTPTSPDASADSMPGMLIFGFSFFLFFSFHLLSVILLLLYFLYSFQSMRDLCLSVLW